jgi:hypothetical protein
MFFTLIASLLAQSAEHYFGPVTVTLGLPVVGNPFDPAENDVRLKLKSGTTVLERLAYYSKGKWMATVLLPSTGKYSVEVWRNGVRVPGAA